MLYFVKDKQLHRYPVPKRCGVKRANETLRDTIPHNVTECVYCMHWWPGEDESLLIRNSAISAAHGSGGT